MSTIPRSDDRMDIRKVAARAHVSTATVSRTINGSPAVNAATAQRVWKAIRELNYHPNLHARSLSSGTSKLLALIISDITNPFFPDLVKSFETVALKEKYEVIFSNTEYDPSRARDCVHRLLQRKVDGFAIMTSEMSADLVDEVRRTGVPLVLLDNGRAGEGISTIHIDYPRGIRAGFEHLRALGHARIAFVHGPQRLRSARVRFRTYKRLARMHNLDLSPELSADGEHTSEGGFQAALSVMRAAPTAIMASNDASAIGVLHALKMCNVRVPEEVSVIGFDDIHFAEYTQPSLTTVRIDRAEVAEIAFHSLTDLRAGSEGREHSVDTQLVIRQSCAAPYASKGVRSASIRSQAQTARS